MSVLITDRLLYCNKEPCLQLCSTGLSCCFTELRYQDVMVAKVSIRGHCGVGCQTVRKLVKLLQTFQCFTMLSLILNILIQLLVVGYITNTLLLLLLLSFLIKFVA